VAVFRRLHKVTNSTGFVKLKPFYGMKALKNCYKVIEEILKDDYIFPYHSLSKRRKRRMENGCFLGLDLGGTQIKAAVINLEGELLTRRLEPTPPHRQVGEIVKRLAEIASDLLRSRPEIHSVGVGSPGLIAAERGIIRVSPNFPAWHDVALGDLLSAELRMPVCLENDVNCFGLAEHRWGAGRGSRQMLALAIGTGVGGALLLEGKLYRGATGAAGELGHVSVDLWGPRCSCGNFGCVERYLGEKWFTQAAQERLRDDSIASPAEVSERAARGDATAYTFIQERGEILGAACVSFINALDPEIIVIGGGISQAGDPLFEGIRRAIQQRAYSDQAKNVKIVPAQLGPYAGAMGAASLTMD
jgi:glucokinase